MRPWHGLPQPQAERGLLPSDLLHVPAGGLSLALEPCAPSHRDHDGGARPGDHRAAAGQSAGDRRRFPLSQQRRHRVAQDLPACGGDHDAGRPGIRAGKPALEDDLVEPKLCRLDFRDHRRVDRARQLAAADVRGPAALLRRLVPPALRADPACGPGGDGEGSPPEHPHGLYESPLPLPLRQHELSHRAPHVSHGALPCPSPAA